MHAYHSALATRIRRFYELDFPANDTLLVADLFAPEYVDHERPSPLGPKGVVHAMALIANALSDRTLRVHDIFEAGDRVVLRFTLRGVHVGNLFGRAPTNRPLEIHGISILRVVEEKIAERWASASIAHENEDENAGLLLWRASHLWQKALAKELAPLELTPAQFAVLGAAGELSENTALQRDVAAHAGTDKTMTSQLLRNLEERGFVERQRDGVDGRGVRISVTRKGRALHARAAEIARGVDLRFFDGVPVATFLRTLITA